MMKRLTWFVSGIAAGAAGAGYAKRKVKATTENLKPVKVAKSVAGSIRSKSEDVADAVREGRQAMHAKELELRLKRDGRLPGTEVIDVEPGKVIVLRDANSSDASGASQPRSRSRRASR